MEGKFLIRFNTAGGVLYYDGTWAPHHKRAKATRLPSRRRAEERLASLREIMALPVNAKLWLAAHMHEAEIVEA